MQSRITIYDGSNINELDWSTDKEVSPYRYYLEKLTSHCINDFISNASGKVKLLKIDKTIIPIFIKEQKNKGTFISSVYS
jgi:hypothetical protein